MLRMKCLSAVLVLVLCVVMLTGCGARSSTASAENRGALAITTLPSDAFLGQSFSSMLVASGGTGSKTWKIISGNLPAGLQLSGDSGVISGTPTVAGIFVLTAQATDSSGAVSSQKFNLIVQNPPTYYHVYKTSGMYDIRATVTDGAGKTASAIKTVVVQ